MAVSVKLTLLASNAAALAAITVLNSTSPDNVIEAISPAATFAICVTTEVVSSAPDTASSVKLTLPALNAVALLFIAVSN